MRLRRWGCEGFDSYKVALGYFWRGSDGSRSCLRRDGDCPEVIWLCSGRLILSRMHAVVIRHGFDGIGFWCWGILYLNSI